MREWDSLLMKPGVVWRRKKPTVEVTPPRMSIGFTGSMQPARTVVVSGSISMPVGWKRIALPVIEKRRQDLP